MSTAEGKRVEAFIIHLARAEKRRPQVEWLKGKLPLPVHVVDGVDGLVLDDVRAAAVYRRHLQSPRYPFELRRTEIACFLSHRKAWQEIVDRDLDAGLIVEDDVAVDEHLLPRVLDLAMGIAGPSDYIRLPFRSYTDKGAVIVADGAVRIVQPKHLGLGMQMQLVGRDAARALLAKTELFDRPVDTTLQLDRIGGVRMLAASPVCIRQIGEQLGGTVVQNKKKGIGEVLSREAKRGWYRLSLWAARSRARRR